MINNIKVFVGMPAGGTVDSFTVKSLMQWQHERKYPSNFRMRIDTLVDKARNELVIQAVEANATHLMFIDSDMIFPPDGVDRLVERQKDIVGGLYFGRLYPKIMAFRFEGNKQVPITPDGPDFEEVDFVGGGFMLINMNVFKKLEPPFFRNSYNQSEFGLEDNPLSPMGEDAFFCMLAKKAGFRVFVDRTIELGHRGTHTYKRRDYDLFQKDVDFFNP